jgi:hypothetical protein
MPRQNSQIETFHCSCRFVGKWQFGAHKRDLKFKVLGANFRTLQPSNCLTMFSVHPLNPIRFNAESFLIHPDLVPSSYQCFRILEIRRKSSHEIEDTLISYEAWGLLSAVQPGWADAVTGYL